MSDMGSHERPNDDKPCNRINGAAPTPSKPIERYSVAQVAKRYGVAPSTVYRWLRRDPPRLGGTQLGGSGPVTFTEADLQRFERGQPPKREAPPASAGATGTRGVDWVATYRDGVLRALPGVPLPGVAPPPVRE